jgi:hypothetical protein
MGTPKILDKRICYYCCTDKTGTSKTGYVQWYRDKGSNRMCKRCYNRLVTNPKWGPINHKKWDPITNRKWSPRQLLFRGKRLRLAFEPRIGVCNLCRAVIGFDCKRTSMHHEDYDETDPLRHTIEVCGGCHNRIEWRKRKYHLPS